MWKPDDLEAAISFELLKAQECPRCGDLEDEWYEWRTGPDGRRRKFPRHPPPYVIERDHCGGCAARDRAQLSWQRDVKRLDEDGKAAAGAGLRFRRRRYSAGPRPDDNGSVG